jgi:hypothetical protein
MGKTCEKANDIILEKAIVLNFNQTQNTINIKLTTLLSNFSWDYGWPGKKPPLKMKYQIYASQKPKHYQI